ncbi:ribonuclease HII [Candidatus Parcubacteria bacterium]|nr:ribonuclease HII [Candidatus Parcubacteria bacterium]
MFSDLEKKVFGDGYDVVAGIDEAGRGALAGPVVAAAVAVKKDALEKISFGETGKFITDSKQLSEKRREEVFDVIIKNPNIEWKVSFIHSTIIDKVNIWQATLAAWKGCLKKLDCQPNFLFLDGNFYLDGSFCRCSEPALNHGLTQMPIIGADRKIFLVSLASIIAKVSRDRLMRKFHKEYPQYEFARHKGYGTKMHIEKLKEFGSCLIHRKSFKPVNSCLTRRG